MVSPPTIRTWAACLCAVSVGLPAPAMATVPSPALAPVLAPAPPDLSPDRAEALRQPVQAAARADLDAARPRDAAGRLDTAASTFGDPVLFLDAADAYLAAAEAEQDPSAIDQAEARARIALDILYFLQGPSASDAWRPVAGVQLGELVGRANETLQRAGELRTALEEAAREETDEVPAKKKGPPGRALILSGAALAALGGAGLAVGVTGLVIGGVNQSKANDPTVYGSAFDEAERKGKLGNTLAYAGLIAGGVLAATGFALVLVGRKKKRAAGGDEQASVRVLPTAGGLILRGRF